MGVNLLLVKDKEIIADLGRAYNYCDDSRKVEKNLDLLANKTIELRDQLIKKINIYIGYTPPNVESCLEILDTVEEELESLREELIGYGQKMLIAILADEAWLEVMTDIEYELKYKK